MAIPSNHSTRTGTAWLEVEGRAFSRRKFLTLGLSVLALPLHQRRSSAPVGDEVEWLTLTGHPDGWVFLLRHDPSRDPGPILISRAFDPNRLWAPVRRGQNVAAPTYRHRALAERIERFGLIAVSLPDDLRSRVQTAFRRTRRAALRVRLQRLPLVGRPFRNRPGAV